MSDSTVIEKTNDELAEDINEGPVVDLGQIDPVSLPAGRNLVLTHVQYRSNVSYHRLARRVSFLSRRVSFLSRSFSFLASAL